MTPDKQLIKLQKDIRALRKSNNEKDIQIKKLKRQLQRLKRAIVSEIEKLKEI